MTKNGASVFALTSRFARTGAIGNLNDGIEITAQGVRTRLTAWPGNGFQTESVHLLTLAPGEETTLYEYDMSDEAMVCFKGQGEVYLRGEWVQIEPGDIAYFPERIPHAVRNPAGKSRDFVLVNQVCPPQFDLYEPGYYNRAHGEMKFDAIGKAKKTRPSAISQRITNCITMIAIPRCAHGIYRWTRSGATARSSTCTVVRSLAGSTFQWYCCFGQDTESAVAVSAACRRFRGATHTHPVSDECIVN